MVFSNKVYDKLKFLAQVVLPALGTLYATLAGLYGLSNSEAVVGTIMAVDFFLGAVLGLSTKSYNNSPAAFDGTFFVEDGEDGKKISLDLQNNPEALGTQKVIVFKNEVLQHVEN